MITMTLKSGTPVGGTFMKETKAEIHVKDPAGKITKYKKSEIASRQKPIPRYAQCTCFLNQWKSVI